MSGSPGLPPPQVTVPAGARLGEGRGGGALATVHLGWPTGPEFNQSVLGQMAVSTDKTHAGTLAQSHGAGRGRHQGHSGHSEQPSHGPHSPPLPSGTCHHFLNPLPHQTHSLDLPKIQGVGWGCISLLPLNPQSNPSKRGDNREKTHLPLSTCPHFPSKGTAGESLWA